MITFWLFNFTPCSRVGYHASYRFAWDLGVVVIIRVANKPPLFDRVCFTHRSWLWRLFMLFLPHKILLHQLSYKAFIFLVMIKYRLYNLRRLHVLRRWQYWRDWCLLQLFSVCFIDMFLKFTFEDD